MSREPNVIPVSEAPARREPMHIRYLRLLRANRNFQRLWLAQLISEIGDWFYSLAIYDLLLTLTGSGKAVSYAIIVQTIPWFLMTPLAGHVADRFSRRRLMVVADVARGFIVAGLLLVRGKSDISLIYLLLGLEILFASIFEPARSAILPNVVREEEILPANALSSATWSIALASGAALGGLVTALFGRRVAFVINSLSFFASALLIHAIRVKEPHLEARVAAAPGSESGLSGSGPNGANGARGASVASGRSLAEGSHYLRQNPKVAVILLAKTAIGVMSGALLLLVIFGERVFPLSGRGALSVGLLYAARGVGSGVGPLIGDRFSRGLEPRMWRIINVAFFVMGASYLAFSRAPSLIFGALAVMCAHCGGSNVWVMSTTLLQLNVPDRLRGRIFALDTGILMAMVSASNYLIGVGLDTWKLTPRQLAAALGCALLVPAIAWLPAQAKGGKGRE